MLESSLLEVDVTQPEPMQSLLPLAPILSKLEMSQSATRKMERETLEVAILLYEGMTWGRSWSL